MSLTFPFRFLFHATGEEGGIMSLAFPLAPFRSHAAGEEGERLCPSPSPFRFHQAGA